MNVSAAGLVFALALQVFFLYWVARLPRIWRGDVQPRMHTVLGTAGYEGAKTRFAMRGIAVFAVGGSVFAATLIAIVFVNLDGAGGYVVVGLLFGVSVVGLGLVTTIALFNRPTFLIPPMMRDRT